jgi:hypothetical protein
MFKTISVATIVFLIIGCVWVIGQTCGVAPSQEEEGVMGRVLKPQCGPNSIPANHRNGRVQKRNGGMPTDEDAVQKCEMTMRDGGLSDERIMQMQVVSQAPIYLDSPSAIYGQAKELDLTSAQKEQLIIIMREAREKALDVLTREQRVKLGRVPVLPITMREICEEMNIKMKHKMKGMGAKCPMCATTQEAREQFEQNGSAKPDGRSRK